MPKTNIRYEYRGAMASTIGRENGLSPAQWAALGKEAAAAVRRVNAARAATPYRDLPTNKKISEIGEVLASVRKKAGRFDDLVVMGIGGSALGLTCLKTALRPPYWNIIGPRGRKGLPRLWVMDNVDPDEFTAMIETIDPRRTLFNIISKSGETSETMSQFLVALDLVRECIGKDWRQHIVITTDRSKGILRPVAEAEGLESFIVPDGVGGRFSVMSPVGLFPAAMIGIDIKGLLAGAAAMDKVCSSTSFAANPAAQAAAVQVGLYRRGKPLSVMMPYSAALKDVADWYCQLWAESLGKVSPAGRFVGPTPIKALGVTDQHSQVQLYREGPADKVFTILSVEKFANQVPLPDQPGEPEGPGVPLGPLDEGTPEGRGTGDRMGDGCDLAAAGHEDRPGARDAAERRRPPVPAHGPDIHRRRDAGHQHVQSARRRGRQTGHVRPDGQTGRHQEPGGRGPAGRVQDVQRPAQENPGRRRLKTMPDSARWPRCRVACLRRLCVGMRTRQERQFSPNSHACGTDAAGMPPGCGKARLVMPLAAEQPAATDSTVLLRADRLHPGGPRRRVHRPAARDPQPRACPAAR